MDSRNNSLIPIFESTINNQVVQTVDARVMHGFLGVGKDFSDWIKAQVVRARLVENRDYVKLPQKGEVTNQQVTTSVGNRIDYHLTIRAATHVALISGTEKGYEVRDYFIDAEEAYRNQTTTPKYANHRALTVHEQAASQIEQELKVGSLFDVPVHIVQQEAVKKVRSDTGVDYSHYLIHAPAQLLIAYEDMMLEPTELSGVLGLKNAATTNTWLQAIGYQVKTKSGWEPTETGKPYCHPHAWSKHGKSGYNLRWNVTRIKEKLNSQQSA